MLTVHADSSFANDSHPKSIHGFVIYLNEQVLAYKSKLLSMFNITSTEAEFATMAFTIKQVE